MDPSPGVRERALALLDMALQQQQQQQVQQQMQQQVQQEEQQVSPWLDEVGGLLRFLRYVVLQETAPSVRQQALRVVRGCAAAASTAETAHRCRCLLIEAFAAAPEHPQTRAFVVAALAADVTRFLAPSRPLATAAAATTLAAAAAAAQTPQRHGSSSLRGCTGSPLAAAAAARDSSSSSSSSNLRQAVRLLAALVAATREHLEVSLIPLLLPRIKQQLQQQQQQQSGEELAAILLDACLDEYLSCCCGVHPQQQQQQQRQGEGDDSLLDSAAAGASLLQLAQELGIFCPRGLLQFVPHVAILLRDQMSLLQHGSSSSSSSSRSLLGEIELLAAAANHIGEAPYHMQQELLQCVPAVLLLLETDPLLLQAGTLLLCRVSRQLKQEGVRDSLLDLFAVSLALIFSIKDRIHHLHQQQQQQQQRQEAEGREGLVPMLQALQFASWAVGCLAAGLGVGASHPPSAAAAAAAATAGPRGSAAAAIAPASATMQQQQQQLLLPASITSCKSSSQPSDAAVVAAAVAVAAVAAAAVPAAAAAVAVGSQLPGCLPRGSAPQTAICSCCCLPVFPCSDSSSSSSSRKGDVSAIGRSLGGAGASGGCACT